MAVVTPSCYATHSHQHSGEDPVTPSHKPIKAQTKDVSGSDSDLEAMWVTWSASTQLMLR